MSPVALTEAIEEAEFGGKATQLGASIRAGLPVPPGFALGVRHVDAVARGDATALADLTTAFEALGGPCAVRSSAIGEDSADASFAGQHLTVLNVRSPHEVGAAVLRVYESGRTEAAMAYRLRLGMPAEPRVAVVVQRMIEPDVAGVMFTLNPLTGDEETVVEATWGLGEAVVGGLVVPDHWEMERTGRVIRERTGDKDIALRSAPDGGTVEVEVAEDLVSAPCLAEAQLARLGDLARACESHFGAGLDIEWAYSGGELYLLQCRPMTRGR